MLQFSFSHDVKVQTINSHTGGGAVGSSSCDLQPAIKQKKNKRLLVTSRQQNLSLQEVKGFFIFSKVLIKDE